MKKLILIILSFFTLSFYSNAQTCGDANGDGSVNVADIVYINNMVLGNPGFPTYSWEADVNCDGVVNVLDQTTLTSYIMPRGMTMEVVT